MAVIETEACGMLGRLQFHVQGIIGFARICTGDVFEVSIRHGHQRWRTRGKTQPDKSQLWDQHPPNCSLQVLWNVPVQVRVQEIGFLRTRCLSDRQFDPAKFAAAQPLLVTMNLNSCGSLKLRLVVTWLPLISSKTTSLQPATSQQFLEALQRHSTQQVKNNSVAHTSPLHSHSSLQRPEPTAHAMNSKLRKNQSQFVPSQRQSGGGSIWETTNHSPSFPAKLYMRSSHTLGNQQQLQQNIINNQAATTLDSNTPSQRQSGGGSIWGTTSHSPSFPAKLHTRSSHTLGNQQQLQQNIINNQAATTSDSNTSIEKKNQQLENTDLPLSSSSSTQDKSPSASTKENVNGVVKVCLREKKRQREQRLKLGASMGVTLGTGRISREASKTDKDRWRCSSTTLLDEVYKDLSKSIPTIDDLSALHSSKSGNILVSDGGGSLGHSRSGGSSFGGGLSSEGRGMRRGAKRILSFVKRGGNGKSSPFNDELVTTAADWRKSVSLAQIPFTNARITHL